ncbi:MAG: polyprenyl synthetase family protein [Pseudomonadota bacterium]|nr:polyprenyl synthetase family protein [Pseudomonadota bacterium]MDE3038232.1 polyprenyl synthetase family protein [Pseudomonadota bacterium]
MEQLLRGAADDDRKNTVISLSPKVATLPDKSHVRGEETVLDAMRYSTLSGGKRLRPFLTVCSAGLFGVAYDSAIEAAAAIEFIHTYSLIHDDLPAMDNDDLRRGKPTCHKQFGEATAILAGDGLLTYAFQVLSNAKTHADPMVRCELISALAQAAGCWGMVGGQMMDMEAENKKLSIEEIIRLQRLKTGELFAVSCEAGAILGKAPGMMRKLLRAYAHDMGAAFQITDDLLDVLGTRTQMGKTARKDKIKGKATLVSAMGVDRARDHAQLLTKQAVSHLDVFDKKADNLRALAQFVIARKG